jgi:YggT family protein
VDSGLLFLLIFLELVKLSLLFILKWEFPNLALLFVWSLFFIIQTFVNFYFILILFRLLLSWILPIFSNYPIIQLVFILTEPVLRPIRQRFATIKGFDWTPIAALVSLKIIAYLVGYALVFLGAPSFIL